MSKNNSKRTYIEPQIEIEDTTEIVVQKGYQIGDKVRISKLRPNDRKNTWYSNFNEQDVRIIAINPDAFNPYQTSGGYFREEDIVKENE